VKLPTPEPGLVVGIEEESLEFPLTFQLKQNYPNPFNPVTNIEFSLPQPGKVTLKIFNVLGEEVTTLVSENLPAGAHRYQWDTTLSAGIASGIYFYRLKALHRDGTYVQSRRMLLLK
jgi:hypothetical protein